MADKASEWTVPGERDMVKRKLLQAQVSASDAAAYLTDVDYTELDGLERAIEQAQALEQELQRIVESLPI